MSFWGRQGGRPFPQEARRKGNRLLSAINKPCHTATHRRDAWPAPCRVTGLEGELYPCLKQSLGFKDILRQLQESALLTGHLKTEAFMGF